jgi:hypothetical protein
MSLLQDNNQPIDETRREFLRKSVYAAYATPVIVTLLVAKKSAAGSQNRGQCAQKVPPMDYNQASGTCVPRL